MPEPSLLQSPRNRFFAVSAVGVAMVCLPLWQVLRYQQSEMRQVSAERALLDPVSQAVHAQFGLLAHRQVSAQMLQGRPQLEGSRRAVQAGVDDQLQILTSQLSQGMWTHALAEARDLTRDWQALARKVAARSISAAQSDQAHTLRLEQAVQVMDLIAISEPDATADSSSAAPGATNRRFATAARLLTSLATDLTLGAAVDSANSPATEATAGESLGSLQARVLPRLLALELALGTARKASAEGAGVQPGGDPVALALADVDRTVRLYLQALHDAQHPTPGPAGQLSEVASPALATHAAWQQAQQAQVQLFKQSLALHRQALARRSSQLAQQQAALLAALALLSALALGLAATLVRRMPAPMGAAAGPAASVGPSFGADDADFDAQRHTAHTAAPEHQPQPSTRVQAAQLMSRLRSQSAAPGATDSKPNAVWREPEDTLPPDRS